jgi:hypothetical protein
MRFPRTLLTLCTVSLTIVPAAAKSSKLEAVSSPVEDKAGFESSTVLDFKRLAAEKTDDGVTLSIETWTAWADTTAPGDVKVAIAVAKPNHKHFYAHTFWMELVDGAIVAQKGHHGGTRVDDNSGDEWAPETGAWQAGIDGTVITVAIPWSQFPVDEPWIQVWCLHAKEIEDEETGEVTISYQHGGAVGVPSDDVPNKGKALVLNH